MSEEIKLSKEAQTVLETVEKMSVLELSELVKALEEKFGVSAAAPVAVAAAPAAGGEAAAEEENNEVSLVLTSPGDKKIAVLKVVREITGLGLKEAKEVVDNCPKPIKEGIEQAEAEELKAKIEAQGGTAEIK